MTHHSLTRNRQAHHQRLVTVSQDPYSVLIHSAVTHPWHLSLFSLSPLVPLPQEASLPLLPPPPPVWFKGFVGRHSLDVQKALLYSRNSETARVDANGLLAGRRDSSRPESCGILQQWSFVCMIQFLKLMQLIKDVYFWNICLIQCAQWLLGAVTARPH